MCLLTGQPEVSGSSPLGGSVISGFLVKAFDFRIKRGDDYEKENS